MEKVVYILGAGFSAPLGLPVMSNFIYQSKEYFREGKHPQFSQVFELVEKLGSIGNYYEYDHFNIEDVLSVLEMNSLNNTGEMRIFTQFIKDVIVESTPDILNINDFKNVPYSKQWSIYPFGGASNNIVIDNRMNMLIEYYTRFVSCLFSLKLKLETFDDYNQQKKRIIASVSENKDVEYSIITLNYDLILETFLDIIKQHYNPTSEIEFNSRPVDECIAPEQVSLLKLHGSIDNIIIPPTWNKMSMKSDSISTAWVSALNRISEANHIRIIGYSLPETDTYIKYLLKSAYLRNPVSFHIKQIDIICIDHDGSLKKKYDNFIKINRSMYRFKNADFIGMLKRNDPIPAPGKRVSEISWNLEKAHNQFMETP